MSEQSKDHSIGSKENHTHCKICGCEIAIYEDICGECACEDDCAYY
ncbi:hypothetical protein LCGC14_1147200 [marine sediment metagenome]|uniref:Uncharacterized protein n=1 Tax=marine sediment metagenome TaxID=412755 RepID=A0A0F9MJT2_9ZZZZ